ncbi:hypothetical protein [Photobacterium minamisatsumaniensis]
MLWKQLVKTDFVDLSAAHHVVLLKPSKPSLLADLTRMFCLIA